MRKEIKFKLNLTYLPLKAIKSKISCQSLLNFAKSCEKWWQKIKIIIVNFKP